MTIEIVDFPIKHGDFPSFFVCYQRVVYCTKDPCRFRPKRHKRDPARCRDAEASKSWSNIWLVVEFQPTPLKNMSQLG